MKYMLIIFLILLNILHSNASNRMIPSHNVSMQYQSEITRKQMLREGRYLSKKYEDASLKLEAWPAQKKEMKRKFYQKNRAQNTSFGANDTYGKKRAENRKREFYYSLQKQEEHIKARVAEADQKLQALKDEFLFRFSVPLSDEEMYHGIVPKIKKEDQKILTVQEDNMTGNSAANIILEDLNTH